MSAVAIRLAGPGDAALFDRVGPDVFDRPVAPDRLAAFLADPRHHIALAHDGDLLIGFVSAVDHLHPDKPPALFIAEVGVAEGWRRRGVGRALMAAMLAHARALGCAEAWVLSEAGDAGAAAFYRSCGGDESDGGTMATFHLGPRTGAP